jgi:hypothetical protein
MLADVLTMLANADFWVAVLRIATPLCASARAC